MGFGLARGRWAAYRGTWRGGALLCFGAGAPLGGDRDLGVMPRGRQLAMGALCRVFCVCVLPSSGLDPTGSSLHQ